MQNYNNHYRPLRALRANLLAASALFLCAGLRVQADGGNGGSTNLTVSGGAGGTGVNGQPGGNGQNNAPNDGTGGGGGGAGGGAGGNGGDGGSGGGAGGRGGAGGTSVSPNGHDAPAAPINVIIGSTAGGGGGGGGGYNGNGSGAASISNTHSVRGGNGGAGANGGMSDPTATNPVGGGGGGGAGGMGLIVLGSTFNTNTGTVTGGNGGKGGDGGGGSDFGSSGGSGGDGGIGILFGATGATLINSGTISGGNGGAAGMTTPDNHPGLGGVGISGGGLTITNRGMIRGGLDGVGNQADAIDFTSGVNTLTLLPGSAITGNVIAFSTADSLILGGSTNATFDVSQIGAGAQYQGFGTYQKIGTGTWTLTNTTTAVTPWTISAGTFAISQDGSLGDPSGALTLNGGTLKTTAAFSSSRNITLLAGGGTFQTDADLTLNGTISNAGSLTKTGAGVLTLNGSNDYSGGVTISTGTIDAEGHDALGTGPVTVRSGASLEIGSAGIHNDITISGTGAGGAGAIFGAPNSLNNVDGHVTLAGNASVDKAAGSFPMFFIETITLGAHDLTLGGGGVFAVETQVVGTGGLTFAPNSVALIGGLANTYTGLTTVSAGAVIFLEKSAGLTAMAGDLDISGTVEDFHTGQLPTTAVVTLSGNGQFNFLAQGVNETIAGLNGTSGTLITPVMNGGGNTLGIAGPGDYRFAGQINDKSPAGSGSSSVALTKSGSGSQEFDRANTYSGGTTLNAGTLIAGNSAAFGTGLMTVNNGTLTVGNGNHAISVNSYTQNGGTLLLNVAGTNGTATADELQVANFAGLGGTLAVNFSHYTVTPIAHGATQTYTYSLVVTNGGDANSFTFDPLDLGRGLTATLDYMTPGDVLLQIVQSNTSFSLAGLTSNQQAIITPINVGQIGPNSTVLINGLAPFSNNPGTLGAALNELSPQAFGQFTSTTAFNNASFETEAKDQYAASQRGGPNGTFIGGNGGIDASGLTLNDPSYDPTLAMVHSRLLAWSATPFANGLLSDSSGSILGGVEMKDTKAMAAPAVSDPWNFFVRGNVILAQGFSDPDVSHFDDNTESVVIGADYRITPNFLVGLTAGYGHTDVTLDDNGSSATVDSYSPGIYASYADHGWYANLSGDYVHNAYTQSRVIGFLGQTASSAPEGNEGVVNLDGGYDFHQGGLTFGPLAGLQYTHLTVDGFTESGSVADLSVNDQNADSLRSRLGGRISFSFSHYGVSFMPHLDATWQHEFMDQSRGITSQFSGAGLGSFSVKTDNPSRDSALVDAGLDAEINQTITVFADYVVQAGQENYFGQSVQAGVKIGF